MFITVRFGDNQQEIFNPHSRVCALLANIKQRCDCQTEDIIDLSDQSGFRKNLYLSPMDYAIKYVDEREVLILVKIERFPGSLRETFVPLLDGLQGDKDFLQNLNKKLNEVEEEANSQTAESEDEKPRLSKVTGRRGSMNSLRKQKSNFAVVGGGKRSSKIRRSQSIAVASGTSLYPKISKKHTR